MENKSTSLFEQTILACHGSSEDSRRTHKESSKLAKPEESYSIDEETINPLLTKFITENYKGVKTMKVVSAKIVNRVLTMECVMRLASGRIGKTSITAKNVDLTPGKKIIECDLGKSFKVESREGSSPMVFEGLVAGNVLSFTGLKYKFNTVSEGKILQVYGTAK
jgi:hypothetical protein